MVQYCDANGCVEDIGAQWQFHGVTSKGLEARPSGRVVGVSVSVRVSVRVPLFFQLILARDLLRFSAREG